MPPPIIIHRPAPDAVTYDLTTPNKVTITIPAGSAWSSGLHWHESHTEYLQLIKGSIRIRLGDTVQIVSAPASADANASPLEIRVNKGVWHEWSRADINADADGGKDAEEVVVIERTDPADGEKALFFWNLNGVILEAQRGVKPGFVPGWLGGIWVMLSLFSIFDALDNIPVFLGVRDKVVRRGFVGKGSMWDGFVKGLEGLWSKGVLRVAATVVWMVGEGAVRRRFTPEREYAAWVDRKGECL